MRGRWHAGRYLLGIRRSTYIISVVNYTRLFARKKNYITLRGSNQRATERLVRTVAMRWMTYGVIFMKICYRPNRQSAIGKSTKEFFFLEEDTKE